VRKLWLLGLVVGLVAAGVFVWQNLGDQVRQTLVPDRCQATVQGRTVTLDPEQAGNAALIAALSVRRGMPAHAATIALAAAYQESKLYNLQYGDRDSLGLFQQRPSQGWGTRAQILDPPHAINAFYDALDRIGSYESMPVTVAAQKVQRSGYPSAYADHEPDARVLASALTGNSRRAFSCRIADAPDAAPTKLDAEGLTPRMDAVRSDLEAAFGPQTTGGYAPGGIHSGHMKGSAHYVGRAVDVFVRPVSPANKTRGWAMAQYLVAQAARLGIEHVIFDGRIWTAGALSGDGWRVYHPTEKTGSPSILMHRDHVHVDVFR
jgi:hypothetical protein